MLVTIRCSKALLPCRAPLTDLLILSLDPDEHLLQVPLQKGVHLIAHTHGCFVVPPFDFAEDAGNLDDQLFKLLMRMQTPLLELLCGGAGWPAAPCECVEIIGTTLQSCFQRRDDDTIESGELGLIVDGWEIARIA